MKYFFFSPDSPVQEGTENVLKKFLIEADEKGVPTREIGMNTEEKFVWYAPTEKNYGIVCDSNVSFGSEWKNDPEAEKIFNSEWK